MQVGTLRENDVERSMELWMNDAERRVRFWGWSDLDVARLWTACNRELAERGVSIQLVLPVD